MKQLLITGRIAGILLITFFSGPAYAQSNNAISFDGTNDYISVPHHAALNVSNFTFEAWINLSNTLGSFTILSKGDGSNAATTNYIFNVGGSLTNSRLSLFAGGAWYSANTVLSTGIWYHAAVTVSGTAVTFYLNGIQDGTATLSGSMYTNGSYLFKIGEQGDGCNCNRMNGKIDEVRVWNTVRTAAEIKTHLFNKNLSNTTGGLLAYYRFNEGSGTTTANLATAITGIDGTLTNGPAWSASPIQFSGNAMNFNGSSNYAQLDNRINLGSSDFTIEAWVYPQSTAAGMVFAQDVCGDANHQFRLFTNNSKVNFDFSDAALMGGNYSFQLPSSANSVPLNTWTHVAVTRSGNTYTLYINGVSNATYSTGSYTINNQSGTDLNKRLRIGARGGFLSGCGLNYFNGSIDDIRFWNVARSSTDISQNYTKEIDPAASNNLVAYYSFNQGIANGTNTGMVTLIDGKGNNNATLSAFTLSGGSSNFLTQNSNLWVLPLKWISFTTALQKEAVLLQWVTAAENHTSHFMVEYSTNNTEWKSLATIPSQNNTVNQYSYRHNTPVNGRNYYRILQKDGDGKYSYSSSKAVMVKTGTAPFRILTNGRSGNTVQVQANEPGQSIIMVNSGGKLVWKGEMHLGINSIAVKAMPPGIYILTNGRHSEKIILQ